MAIKKITVKFLEEQDYVFLDTDFQGRSILSLLLSGRYLEIRKMISDSKKYGKNHEEMSKNKSLEYWLNEVNKLEPNAMCPFCGRRPVRYFLTQENRYGFREPDYHKMCCDNDLCKTRCTQHESGYSSGLRPLGFIASNKKCLYDLKSNFNKQFMDHKWVTELLKTAYTLPEKLFSTQISPEEKNRIALKYMTNRLVKR